MRRHQGWRAKRVLADLARGRMRSKRAELERALSGHVRDHHRFLLAEHLGHIDYLDEAIERFNQQITAHIAAQVPPPHVQQTPMNAP